VVKPDSVFTSLMKRVRSINSEMLLDFSLSTAGDRWLHLAASHGRRLPHPAPGTGSLPPRSQWNLLVSACTVSRSGLHQLRDRAKNCSKLFICGLYFLLELSV